VKKRLTSVIPMVLVLCMLLVSSAALAAEPENTNDILVKEVLTEDDWSYIDSLPLEQKQNLLVERIQNISQEPTIREIAAINNMSEAEYTALLQQQQEAAEYLIKNGAAFFAQGQQEMEELYQKDPEAAKIKYPKEFTQTSNIAPPAGSRSSVGDTGDILITQDVDTCKDWIGHAGIVSTDSSYTMESWPEAYSPISEDGVQVYDNDWSEYSPTWGLRVYYANSGDYDDAAEYAEDQEGKEYNWIFINRTRTDKFYCSQLVWRSWLEQGFDTDDEGPIVWPADLYYDDDTYCFTYH